MRTAGLLFLAALVLAVLGFRLAGLLFLVIGLLVLALEVGGPARR